MSASVESRLCGAGCPYFRHLGPSTAPGSAQPQLRPDVDCARGGATAKRYNSSDVGTYERSWGYALPGECRDLCESGSIAPSLLRKSEVFHVQQIHGRLTNPTVFAVLPTSPSSRTGKVRKHLNASFPEVGFKSSTLQALLRTMSQMK